jgi:uncharacterized membrane protein YjjB (DUF3815 family)
LHEPIETAVVAFCPCTVLVPGSHLLNGAIDLVRTRIALGVARLTYAGIIVLMICFGLLLGFAAGGAPFPAAGPSTPVPLLADVIAAGCAVASFGTFFSMPWRMLPFPMGADLARGGECRDRSARGLRPRQHHRHTGRRPPASTLAALAFSAVVSMMPGFFLFQAASAFVELVSSGPSAPVIC